MAKFIPVGSLPLRSLSKGGAADPVSRAARGKTSTGISFAFLESTWNQRALGEWIQWGIPSGYSNTDLAYMPENLTTGQKEEFQKLVQHHES